MAQTETASLYVTIPEEQQDKTLSEKLRAEFPGILAWAVRGCLDWQKHGLGSPPEVEHATQQYRNDMDIQAQFLADCCQIGPDLNIGATDLYTKYESWAKDQGIRQPWTQAAFGWDLSERGFTQGRESGTGRSRWNGLAFCEDCE